MALFGWGNYWLDFSNGDDSSDGMTRRRRWLFF